MVADLRALKLAVLTGLASRLAGEAVHGVSPRTRRGPDSLRVSWEFDNGTHGLIHVATIKQGLPTGAFALEPRLIVSGGPLVDALSQCALPSSSAWESNHYLVNADCRQLGGASGTFVIRPAQPDGINRVNEELASRVLPALTAFSGDWAIALDLTMRLPDAVAFAGATAAILIGWTGSADRELELRRRASQEPWLLRGMSAGDLDRLIEEQVGLSKPPSSG